MFPAWNNTHDVIMHSSPPRNTKVRPPASIKVDHEKASAIQDVHVVGAFPEALPRNGTTAGGIIINVDVVPDECNQSCPGDYRGVGERGSRRLSLEIAVGSPRGPRPSGRGRNAGRGSAGTNSGMIGSNGAVGGVGLGAKANKIGRNQGGNVRSAVLLSKSRSESLHDISTPHHNASSSSAVVDAVRRELQESYGSAEERRLRFLQLTSGNDNPTSLSQPQQDLQYKSPFPEEERGATLDWDSLTFEVGGKKILDNCYGRLFPGEVCALIGPSGAGKSTLMNLLAARQRWNGQGLKLDGTIRFGGRPAGYEGLKDSVALIMQAESFVETQTVEESLRFAAILRGVEESISDEEVLLEAADHEPTEPEAAEQDEAEISEADETTALSPGKGSQEKKRPFLSRQDSLEYEYGDLESGRGAEPALSATLTTKSKPASNKPKSVTSTRKSARNSVSPVSRGKARKRVLARKIDETLEMLGLESCRNTPVLRISGGQKKRVGVALELISNPKILFLDEPTSGLDSFSSLQLVQNLRRVAREREAIVCLTVHQPSSELFSLFDRVYCMRYGKLLFHGLNKNMENVISACREGVAAEQAAAAVPPGPQKQAKSEPQSEQHDEMSFGTPAIISQGEHHNAATTGTSTDHKILAPSSAAEFVPPPYAASAARARTSGNEQDGASSATARGGAVQSSRTKAMELCLFLKSWTIPGFLALVRQPIPMEFSTCDWLLNLAQSLDDAEIQALIRKSRSIFDAGLVSLSEFDIIVRRAIEEHLPQVKREKVLKREYVEALEAIAKDAPPMASPRVAQAGGQGTAARGIENYLPQQQDLRRDMVSGADARNGANIAGNPNHGGELAPQDGLTQTTTKNGTPPDPEPPIDPATCAPHHPYSTQKLRPRERPNCCTQVRALLIREIQSTYRNTFSLMFRVLTPIVQVALYSIAFWSTGRYLAQGQEIGPAGELVPLTERAQFSARIRDLFISIATVYFMSFTAGAQVVLLNIPAERAVFLREYTSNMYSTWAYLLSKMLVELPITMFQTLVIAGIIRGGYGYNSSFFWMWLLLFLSMTSGGAVGVAISTLTSRAEVSLVLLTVITNTIPACFGGVMRALSQIPAWVRWMKHIIQMSHIAATMGLVELEAIDVTAISEDPTAQANFEAERQAFWKGNDIRREMLPYYLSMTLLLWLLFRGLGAGSPGGGVKSHTAGRSGKTIEQIYQKKTQLEHILLRPDTYVGSCEPQMQEMWVFDESTQSMQFRKITYSPALYKIFDEILVNAADHLQRSASMDVINVKINKLDGTIAVYNNGAGVPVVMHQEHKIYVPELIFGNLLTSDNYDDNEKKVTGGRNGFGAKLTNVFSKKFVIETADAKEKKRFTQVMENNMSVKNKPKIEEYKKEPYTRVTFTPDLAKFHMTELDDDTIALFYKRVFLNDKRLPITDFKSYCEFFVKSTSATEIAEGNKPLTIVHEKCGTRWEVCVTLSLEQQFQQVSFVNSINTIKGGTHVAHVTEQLVEVLLKKAQAGNKKGMAIKPANVKQHLWVFVNCLVENPAFDSQTKETLKTQASKFGTKCELSDAFIKDVQKSGVIDMIVNWAKAKEKVDLGRKLKSSGNQVRVLGIPKLEDANEAGGKKSSQCTLILTEGDSAKALAVAGLSVIGRDFYGVFPLRGKLLNVREAAHATLLKNAEIQAILKIMGLTPGVEYDDLNKLRYGSIMIMTDQDLDGSHIKGLLINLIEAWWPSLMKYRGFLKEFVTPIIKVHKGGKNEKKFYTLADYELWKGKNNNGKGWDIKYYKGLGTSTAKEAKEYFRDIEVNEIKFTYDDSAKEAVDLAFNKTRADDRKDWMNGAKESDTVDHNKKELAFTDFVNKELVWFSKYAALRAIPNVIDGFKPGQRKIIFCAFKKKIKKDIKVAQFVGYVSEKGAYHHGEKSLEDTIVNMAQDFVGSNNLNLFFPSGQFGTRLAGGSDHASAR
eukprot:g10936.t1